MSAQAAIAIGLVLYVVLTTGVSFFWMARVKRPSDYLVAGRGLQSWVLIGTIIGTCIGTGVIIGGSGLAYKHGWAGCAYPIGLGLGTLLTGVFFGQMRRYRFMTLSEEIACYYDRNRIIVEFSNITLFFSQLCWLTVQIMGGAAVLGAVTGLNPKLCVVLAGFAKAIISIPGGLKAVVYTDVLQTIILFCGFGFLMYSALGASGGLAGLQASVPASYTSFLGTASYGGWNVAALILVLVLNPIADPGRRLTFYSASSEAGAKWSMIASGLAVMAFSIIIGVTGMYAFRLNPNLKMPDQALTWLVMNSLPVWVAALVVVAVVSGISSAANGCAAAAGTFFVRHIYPLVTGRYPRQPVVMARWALACGFFASTVLALYTRNIVDFVKEFLPLTMSGLGVIILLGRFWKRSTWQGGLAALLATPTVCLIFKAIPAAVWAQVGESFPAAAPLKANAIIPATVAGLLAHVVVSACTPRSRRSFAEIAEILSREREAIEGGPVETGVAAVAALKG